MGGAEFSLLRLFFLFYCNEHSKDNEGDEKEEQEEKKTSPRADLTTTAIGQCRSRLRRSKADWGEEGRSLTPDHFEAESRLIRTVL